MGKFLARISRAALVYGFSALLALLPIAEGFARNPRGTALTQPPAPTGLIKFAPGHYGLAGNALYNTPPGGSTKSAVVDITTMLSNGAIADGLLGYTWGAQWTTFDKTTVSTSPTYDFSTFWQIANLLQALWPGAHPRFRYTGNHYAQSVTAAQMGTANMGGGGNDGFFVPHAITASAGSLTVPNGFGSAFSTTYPVAAIYSGSPNYGLNFQDHSGTVFGTVTPQWYNPGVMQMFINSVQAFFASTCPNPTVWASGTTYSAGMQVTSGGLTYTYINNTAAAGNAVSNTTFWKQVTSTYAGLTPDQILYGFGFNDEVSNAFITADNITGVTVNPPLSVTGGSPSITVAPTNTNFWIQQKTLLQAAVTAAPHTVINSIPTFGWGAGSSVDTATNMAANWNVNAPSGNRTAPLALSTIKGLALSAADTYGLEFNATNNRANPVKQGFDGIVAPGTFGGTLPTPTVANLIGAKEVDSQVQASDYFFNVLGAGNNASAVTQIITAGLVLHSQVFEWCLIDQTNFFPTYLLPTLGTNPLPASSRWRTPDIMSPITINSVTVASSTSLDVVFTPFSLDAAELGLQYEVDRDGVAVGTTTTSPYLDTGLTTGVSHNYTMRMTNSNGTGPAGASVSGTPH